MKTKNRPLPIPVNRGGNSTPDNTVLLGAYVPRPVALGFRALAKADGRTVSGLLNKLLPEILKANGYDPETVERA